MTDFLGINLPDKFHFVGIGPPMTPDHICRLFSEVSSILSSLGGVLRSGGDEGGDASFEAGAAEKEIYLPYPHYNKNPSPNFMVEPSCIEIAKSLHPAWHRCSEFAKKAHSRHVYEILGAKLDDPAAVLICWTEDGVHELSSLSGKTGILRTAIALALRTGIPVVNAGYQKHEKLLIDFWNSRRTGILSVGINASDSGVKTGASSKRGFQTLRR